MRIIPDLKQLIGFIAHRRIIAFWVVAAVALPAPWLVPGCASRMATENKNVYENCQVLNVHDGDTMTVSCQGEKIKVRLYCIDAPELGQEPWGQQSRNYLRGITEQVVQLEVIDEDRYGRTVGVVRVGGSMHNSLNLLMVQSGSAAVYPKYCRENAFFEAQSRANQNGVGIWMTTGAQQTPWVWRKGSLPR